MRQPLVTGNWKMNGSKQSIADLLDGLKQGVGEVNSAELAVCPPAIYIPQVADSLANTPIKWGGQNLSVENQGAFTGEISGDMLTDFNARYVIVGHSERRSLYGETDTLVADKVAKALACGLTPILCVGELLSEREAEQTESVVNRQLDAVVAKIGIDTMAQVVVAYEPVWAIGTGKTATPEQAQDVHAFIRQRIAVQNVQVADGLRILYGGSMKADNAADLMAQPDIDGGLIGGASLKAVEFLAICKAAG
jgi:triosephosphate isomerase